MTTNQNTLRIFNDAVVIVTGGASGIGRALAEELAKRGCEVVLADLQIELAKEVASGIRAAGGKATAVEVDVTDFSAVEALIQDTVEGTGRLDYMFNNAGIAIYGEACDYRIEDWDRIIDVNLRGVINGIQAAYQVMLNQGFGHIVNTASVAGLAPIPLSSGYTTTKHAVVGLSKALRIEAALKGIRISVICPGPIHTPILDGGKYGKLVGEYTTHHLQFIKKQFTLMPPDIFARNVLNAVAKNKAIILVPTRWKLLWWMHRLAPSLMIFLTQIWLQKIQKELSNENLYKKG